jgi:DNA-binding response OmpR family regulator
MKILLVEDEKAMNRTLKKELSNDYIVKAVFSGKEGEYLANVNDYDIIILDVLLPDIDGITLCQTIRSNHIKTPILMLTGISEITKKIIALDSGADDYLIKPFHFVELRARIRALLRRQPEIISSRFLIIADLQLDLINKTVRRGEQVIILRRKELQILEYFMRHVGKIITRDSFLEHLWDSANESFANTIDVHIKYLRDQVDRPFEKKLIKTVYGFGYKIEA